MPDNENGSIVITESNSVLDYTHLFDNNWKVQGFENENSSQNIFGNTLVEKKQKRKNANDKSKSNDKGFFVKNENGGPPDKLAMDFFDLINIRAGEIFDCDSNSGEVYLKDVEITFESVKSSAEVSQVLAKLIYMNCGARAPQIVLFRVGNNLLSLGHTLITEDGSVLFDDYREGTVDMDDYLQITDIPIQTALLAHIIFERVSTPNYEFAKGGIGKVRWNIDHHSPAKKIEITVLKDMKQNPTLPEREEYALEDEEYNQYIFNWGAIKAEFKHTFKTSKISGFKKF